MLGNFLLDTAAPIYDWLTAQEIWRTHIRERIASRLPEHTRDVLDDGTGPGVSAFAIAAARPGVRVTGLDISGPMIDRARPHHAKCPDRERIAFVQGDAMALPFPDASFDGVTGHSFLYLMPDRAKALSEAHRVLRPKGRIVLLEPRAGFHLPGPRFLAQSVPFGCSMVLWRLVSRVEGRFSEATLADTLAKAGFTVLSIEPTLGGLGLVATAERE
jgi:ubiquinone/menaquinone biosynthesis C-methylase UbiE